jgi:hypothetical protein
LSSHLVEARIASRGSIAESVGAIYTRYGWRRSFCIIRKAADKVVNKD